MAKKATKKNDKKSVKVKSFADVTQTVNHFIFMNAHDRYNLTFSNTTKEKLVAYGPWLATFTLLVLAPELLVLARESRFITLSSFIETILFSKSAWVILLVIFANCLLLVSAIEDLFAKKKPGWNQIYLALLINLIYVIYQFFYRIEQPAAPTLSLIAFGFCLFALLDVRKYYK